MSTLLAAVEWGGAFELPPVGELFNFEGWVPFGLEFLEINRVVLITLTATLIAAAIFVVAFSKPKIVPDRLQSAAEALVTFIREQVAVQIIGAEGVRYVPFLLTLFMFIWLNNLFEIIPLVNFPSTSRSALPVFLGVLTTVVFVGLGIKHQGLRYFKEVAFPPGVPIGIYPILAPIEIVATFILRPFTLAVRLFANMVAGHILLTIVFIAIHAFLHSGPGLAVGAAVLIVSPIAVGFELFIATLQAYIFAILAAVYISGALHPEH